jgi:shikimate kinase
MTDATKPQTLLTKPIVLVGPMGVGKTTVGKKLAKVLKTKFVDTDSLVTAEHGDISKIFDSLGEATFRGYEEAAVAKALEVPAIVATGGGAVLSATTRERLKGAVVIYLSSDGRHMGSRLSNGRRPLLKKGLDDWRRIYDERKPMYEAVADFNVLVSGLSLSATVAKIRDFVGV